MGESTFGKESRPDQALEAGRAPYLDGKDPFVYAKEAREVLEGESFGNVCEVFARIKIDYIAAEDALKTLAGRFIEALRTQSDIEGNVTLERCYCDHWYSEVHIDFAVEREQWPKGLAFLTGKGVEDCYFHDNGAGNLVYVEICFKLNKADEMFNKVVGAGKGEKTRKVMAS